MKHISFLDRAFFVFILIFFSIGGYEIFRLLQPYYHFGYVLFVVLSVTIIYGIYKFESGDRAIQRLFGWYMKHTDVLLTAHLGGTLFILIASFYIGKFHFLPWVISLFLFHFLFLKIHRFDINYALKGENIKNPNAWRIFLITYAGCIIICSAMFRLFALDISLHNTYYIGVSLLYVLGGVAVFFDISQFFEKKNIGVTEIFLVSILLCILGYTVFTLLF